MPSWPKGCALSRSTCRRLLVEGYMPTQPKPEPAPPPLGPAEEPEKLEPGRRPRPEPEPDRQVYPGSPERGVADPIVFSEE
jgi:hypothetical protein